MNIDNNIEQRFDRLEKLIKLSNKNTLTIEDVANYTGYKKSYLYKMTAKQKIPHYKPSGGNLFFDRAEIEEWLQTNRIPTIEEIENITNSISIGK